MWLEILAAATIILSRAQRMQLTLVYGPTAAAVLSAHPLMMADPFSLIELLNKKGMLRGMAISSRAMHRVRMRRNRMRQHFDTKHCAGRHSNQKSQLASGIQSREMKFPPRRGQSNNSSSRRSEIVALPRVSWEIKGP